MTVTTIQGDCREVLKAMPAQSVNCCVTSPPYYGLRDYGTAAWEGGNVDCTHQAVDTRRLPWANDVKGKATASGGKNGTDYSMMTKEVGGRCSICGAVRIDRQIGLEETPAEYVAALVDVFRDVRDALRDDGTLWLIIGDSYAGSWSAQGHRDSSTNDQRTSKYQIANHPKKGSNTGTIRTEGLKPKDLIGIPWMTAFALRADGWYLRQDNIWHKPNPMPESVTDRCTKAHEYIFLLSKSERYYFDADAIAEGAGNVTHKGKTAYKNNNKRMRTKVGLTEIGQRETRNKRSVWTVATRPYKEAHFATFPPDLIEPCILAGCPEGGTVLDPFGGAGTTGLVSDRLKRNATLIELNPEYAAMAKARIANDAGMFAT